MHMRLSRSFVGQAEATAVAHILCEDGYLGMGAEVQRFEADIAAYIGVAPEQVIVVNSGTAALHLAVEAVCMPGDAVLVPSLTFVASFQAITAAGCVPIACDVSLHSATIDLDDAARRLTERTRAIMPVHYASNPWQLDAIYAFAAQHSLRVIEDAAHAFGCRVHGRALGGCGDMVCFSFDGIKNITSGEGGCIIAHDAKAAQLCADARLLSVVNDTQQRYAGGRSWDFDVLRQGWRFHMSNICAAIGRVQLARLDTEFALARRALAALYRERLAHMPGVVFLQEQAGAWIVPHIFPIRILHGRRDAVREALAREGIPTGIHYKPNHMLTYFAQSDTYPLPITEQLYTELLTLPLHPGLNPTDVERICHTLRRC